MLALRHQLNVLQRSVCRPELHSTDRWLWILLARLWRNWRSALKIVKPDAVLYCIGKGFICIGTGKVIIVPDGPPLHRRSDN